MTAIQTLNYYSIPAGQFISPPRPADLSACPFPRCVCADPGLPRVVCVATAVGQLLASQHEARRAA